MYKEKNGSLTVLESYFDMLINLVSAFSGYIFTLMMDIGAEEINILHPPVALLIFLAILAASFTYHVMNIYENSRYSRPSHDFAAVLKANSVYFGILAFLFPIFTDTEYSEAVFFWIVFTGIISTLFISFKRSGIRALLNLLHSKNFRVRRVVLIGNNTAAAHYVKELLGNSEYGMTLLGCVGDKIDGEAIGALKLGSLVNLEKILDQYKPTDAVFAIDSYDRQRLIRMVNICDDRCIKVYMLPVAKGFFRGAEQIEELGALPLVKLHKTPLDKLRNQVIKRTVDIVGSVLLIIITAPVMIFAAVGVYFSSPGPILFRQTRIGRLGKSFIMLKFRSMRINKDSHSAWTTADDPRKTKFGTFLRRTAIDELPQLFNVLTGSMSLVGPRPEIPVFVEHFKEIIPLYMIKHYVKPGITGLAQIKGLRGDTSVRKRIQADIQYIENWSLFLDIKILLKTPFKAFNKSERYTDKKKPKDRHGK